MDETSPLYQHAVPTLWEIEPMLDEENKPLPSIRAPKRKEHKSITLPKNKQETMAQKFSIMLLKRLAPRLLKNKTDLLAKYSDKLGNETAEIIFKNTSKMTPLTGAIPSAIAVKDMFDIALNSPVPEARYLASIAMKLNAGDAALSIIEPLIAEAGLPVAADIALGSLELCLELTIHSIQKEAQSGNYEASDELKTFIGLLALRNPTTALAELTKEFGFEGALDILKTTVQTVGDAIASPFQELFKRLSK